MQAWNESVTVFKLRVLRKSPQGRHTSTLFFFTIFSAAAQVLPELPLMTPARSIALAFSSKTRARPRSLLHAQLCAGAGACYSHCCRHGRVFTHLQSATWLTLLTCCFLESTAGMKRFDWIQVHYFEEGHQSWYIPTQCSKISSSFLSINSRAISQIRLNMERMHGYTKA